MLGITLRDRKRNTWIRQETSVSDIINAIRKAKQRWAGHIARLSDNRWTIRATEWTLRDTGLGLFPENLIKDFSVKRMHMNSTVIQLLTHDYMTYDR